MKFFSRFLMISLCTVICAPAMSETFDNRKRVDWKNYPKVVEVISSNYASCTGQFVAPNLILTAAHCADTTYPATNEGPFTIINNQGTRFKATMVRRGEFTHTGSETDWMFLLVSDKQYYNQDFFDIYTFTDPSQKFVPVENVGWGVLKIITDADMDSLRATITNGDCSCKEICSEAQTHEICSRWTNETLCRENLCEYERLNAAYDLVKTWDNDGDNLKASTCNVLYNLECDNACKYQSDSDDPNSECSKICKGVRTTTTEHFPHVLYNTCVTACGNSGGAYYLNNKLVSIVSTGAAYNREIDYLLDGWLFGFSVAGIQFNNVLQELKKQYPPVADDPVITPSPESCDKELKTLNAKAAERDTNGKCRATKCVDAFAIITDAGKCQVCPQCATTTATCRLYVADNKCEYDTKCKDNEIIENDGTPNASCKIKAPDEYSIIYELGDGIKTGCESAPNKYTVGKETVVNCQPIKEGFQLEHWEISGDNINANSNIKMPYTISKDTTGNIRFYVNWKEIVKPRTECDATEKAQFPHANKFKFESGKCIPTGCEDNYELDTETNQCNEQQSGPTAEQADETISQLTKESEDINNAIAETVIRNDDCINDDKCLFAMINQITIVHENEKRIKQLEKAYQKAKERETSFANRMLGGLTMAATGIGGMELAQGLAEQKADEAAERDMEAYMATFQCKVGDQRYSGGTMGIETPGANQLTSLYQEYVELAADLKERKAALGMKAGIESEVILDKNNMGLYDDVGHGIENGTYASLYRAKMGNENDIKKLEEQKNTSANRVKGGAIAAGGGALGGMVGNVLINHTGDDDNTKSDNKSSKSTSGSKSSTSSKTGGIMDNLGGTLGNITGNIDLGSLGGVDASGVQNLMQGLGK